VRTVRMQDCGVQCEEEGHCGLTETSWEFGDYSIVKSVTTYSPCPQVRVFPLQYLEVSIEENKCTSLNDSGCQIPIVSNRLFGWCAEGAVGRVNLHGFGQDHVVQAPLVNLTVKMCYPMSECDDMLEIPLMCAVTDLGSVYFDVILSAAVVSDLQAPAVSAVLSVGDTSNVDPVTQTADFSGQVEPREVDILNVDDILEDNVEWDFSMLIAEQKADPSVSPYLKAADGCVDGCAVVNDAGVGFSHVVRPANVVLIDLSSAHTEEEELERLVELRSRELLRLVDGVADRVSDEAGLCDCDAAVHRVQATIEQVCSSDSCGVNWHKLTCDLLRVIRLS